MNLFKVFKECQDSYTVRNKIDWAKQKEDNLNRK